MRGTALAAVTSPRALPCPRRPGAAGGPRPARASRQPHRYPPEPVKRGCVPWSRLGRRLGSRRRGGLGTQLPSAALSCAWRCGSWLVVLNLI